MSETKHTPGPWHKDGIGISAGSETVCIMGEKAWRRMAAERDAWAEQVSTLTRELERARAEAERLRDSLQTVVDEQVSPHETLPAEELIALLEHSLVEGRHERERLRGALLPFARYGHAVLAVECGASRMRIEVEGETHEVTLDDWKNAAIAALGGEGEVDPLHPNGRCTCAGEGECEWCKRTEASLAGEVG